MQRPWWLVLVLGGLIAASPHSDENDLEGNRLLLEKWRADKPHYDRLRMDLRAFYKLPADRQERLRRIDRELHEEDPAVQIRLWAVLDRYRAWIEHLPETERQQVLAVEDPAARIQLIRRMKLQQWIDRQPLKIRTDLMKLPLERRAVRVLKLQREERAQKLDWLRAAIDAPLRPEGIFQPAQLEDFPLAVQQFVSDQVIPHLSPAENEQLQKAKGKWPDLAQTIRQLSDRHPVLPPGTWGVIEDENKLWQRLAKEGWNIQDKRKLKGLLKGSGKWPTYALKATEVLRKEGNKIPPLGASRPSEFPLPMKVFINEKLLPVLTSGEKESLTKVEGLWPEYPKRLLELARLKRLVIPGMSLPGPRELWEPSRAALPAVPDRVLCDFAMNELNREDRANLELSPADVRGSLEKLRAMYFKRKSHVSYKGDRGKRGSDRSKGPRRSDDE